MNLLHGFGRINLFPFSNVTVCIAGRLGTIPDWRVKVQDWCYFYPLLPITSHHGIMALKYNSNNITY